VRDTAQGEFLAELGEVEQHLGKAAVVGLEVRLESQEGEQLVLRMVLGENFEE
jgi:hypothetical protein